MRLILCMVDLLEVAFNMSKAPNATSEGQDPDYQYLSEIQTSMDMTGAEYMYEYPLIGQHTPSLSIPTRPCI